jgi:AcrR family transcriptional regulator
MPRKKGDHTIGRTAVAEAAARVLIRRGMAGGSLQQMADELGSTTGRIRHYFANKEALLLFTKNLFVERMFEAMRRAADEHEGVEKLVAMGMQMLPISVTSIEAWKLLAVFKGTAIADRGLLDVQIRRTLDGWQMFEAVYDALREAGEIPSHVDCRAEGIACCAFLEGMAEQMTFAPGRLDDSTAESLVRSYVNRSLLKSVTPHRMENRHE